jgi:hypothetical protein
MSKQPKKVVEAFTAAGSVVGKIHLREFSISTLLIMQKIACPLISGDKSQMTDMEVLRLVFILANPPQESLRLISESLATFDEAVMVFGENLTLQDMPKIGPAINKLFERAMSTAPGGASIEKKRVTIPSGQSRQEGAASAGS